MRVLFAGTPEVALPALNAIAASEHELVGVLTRPDAPSGRGRKLQPSPVAAIGHELGVPVFTPAHPKDPEFQQQLTDLAPDCCPVVAYGALLPSSVLQIPKHGWINLHFSLLPHWRGAAPVQHAIWAGDDFTGATTFQIVPELDAGPVFGVLTEKIQSTDTTGELLTRLSVAGAELLVATLSGVASGDLAAVPQPEAEISYAAKISAADAQIDWTLPGFAVDRQIRAMTPAPGAWTNWLVGNELERIKIGPVHLLPSSDLAAGAVQINKNSITVGTANLDVQLSWVQAKGKKQMAATDWARGLRTVGELRFW